MLLLFYLKPNNLTLNLHARKNRPITHNALLARSLGIGRRRIRAESELISLFGQWTSTVAIRRCLGLDNTSMNFTLCS